MKNLAQAGIALLSMLAAPGLQAAEDLSKDAMLAAQAKLGYQLLAGLSSNEAKDAPPQTIMVSPASLAGALSAIDIGADDALHKAIAKSLGFADDADAALAKLRDVAKALKEIKPGEGPLSFANAIFFAPAVNLSPVVSDELKSEEIDSYSVNLGSAEGIAQINDWVSQRTAGLIPQLLAQPLPTAVIVALNALYFKDNWLAAFDPADTRPGPFRVAGGYTELPLMHMQEKPLWVREDDKFVGVALAFEAENYFLTVVTNKGDPAALKDLEPAVSWLTGEGFDRAPANLTLPKFDIDYASSLLPIVEELGLSEGYSGKALAKFGVLEQITAIIQKTVFKVDEVGAEAAAATAVIVDRSLGKKDAPKVVDVVIDRPFLFSLIDEKNGLVLLTGYVPNPGGPDAVVTPGEPPKAAEPEEPKPAEETDTKAPSEDEPAKGVDLPEEEEAAPATPPSGGTTPAKPKS